VGTEAMIVREQVVPGQRSISLRPLMTHAELFALAPWGPSYRRVAIPGRPGNPVLVCLGSACNQVVCQVFSRGMEDSRRFRRGNGGSDCPLGLGTCTWV